MRQCQSVRKGRSMGTSLSDLRSWLGSEIASGDAEIIYGFAELGTLLPENLRDTPRGISFAVRMDDALMDSIRTGPHAVYYAEYSRVNALINALSEKIAMRIREAGHTATWVHSSERVDFVNIAGAFPHKTGAVKAGLGWIGRSCQLVTRDFGPRVRLGTVLTDMPLGEEEVVRMRSYCGTCRRCVEACPVGALTGGEWSEKGKRDDLLDARSCDNWKKEHYAEFNGMVCGICTSACPHGKARPRENRA